MKKNFLIIFLLISLNSFSQNFLEIKPFPVNITGDSAHFMNWKFTNFQRSDTIVNIQVSLYDKNKFFLDQKTLVVPFSTINNQSFTLTRIDNYILSRFPRIQRK